MLRFVLAGLSLIFAVVTGVEWLGQPLRLVHLVTIIGLSMLTGVLWMQAVMRTWPAGTKGNGESAV